MISFRRTVLEEGIAIYFSLFYLETQGYKDIKKINLKHLEKNYPKYFGAYKNVSQIDNLFKVIKQIREEYPDKRISDLRNEHLLLSINSNDLVLKLIEKFNV